MTQTKALILAQSTSLDFQEIKLPTKQPPAKQEFLGKPALPKMVAPQPTLADKLFSIAYELDILEPECDPNNRGYIFQLRKSLLNIAALETRPTT